MWNIHTHIHLYCCVTVEMLNGIIHSNVVFIILYLFVVICYCQTLYHWLNVSDIFLILFLVLFYSQFSVQHFHPAPTNWRFIKKKMVQKLLKQQLCNSLHVSVICFLFYNFREILFCYKSQKNMLFLYNLHAQRKCEIQFLFHHKQRCFCFQKKSSNKNTYLIYFYFLFHFYHFPFPYFRRQVLNVIKNNWCLMFQFRCEKKCWLLSREWHSYLRIYSNFYIKLLYSYLVNLRCYMISFYYNFNLVILITIVFTSKYFFFTKLFKLPFYSRELSQDKNQFCQN